MITRIWRGWTTAGNAHAYETLLLTEIFAGIERRELAGYRGISLCKRVLDDEVEFMTVMWFDALESVKAFAGDDYQTAVVPDKARELLSRYDERSAHYETVTHPVW